MAELSGLVDIEKVVSGLVYKMRLDPYYQTRFYQYAIDGAVELNLYTLGETKVEKLTMDSTLNTINFPSDYLQFIDLAIPKSKQLWSLTKKNTIINTTTLVNGAETYNSDIGEGVDELYFQTDAGGRNERYYKIDEKNRRIIISGVSVTTIWLIYISTGISTDDTTYISRKAKPALEAYIRYQHALNDLGSAAAKLAIYENNWRLEKNKLKRTKLPTLQEFADGLAATYYKAAK